MIVLHFSMQGGIAIKYMDGKCCVLTFQYARVGILEHNDAKCHLCTLSQLVDDCVT
jgi:hypothetical protein